MTSTEKSVRRVTTGEYRTVFSKTRRVVVKIGPGDILEFRELGRRTRLVLDISDVLNFATNGQFMLNLRTPGRRTR
jgi:hypothetical protein